MQHLQSIARYRPTIIKLKWLHEIQLRYITQQQWQRHIDDVI